MTVAGKDDAQLSPIAQVSDTAFMVAHHRAVEAARTDALFADPLAGLLAGDHGKRAAEHMPTHAMTNWTVAMRTLVIDGYLREALDRGVDVVLNLGAGLDTRPWRLDLPPNLRWLEVDQAHVMAYKTQTLKEHTPQCRLEQVPLDLTDTVARREFLTAVDRRCQRLFVLTEGVLPYLDVAAAGALADDLAALAHLHGWVVDYVSPEVIAYRQRMKLDDAMQNAPFQFTPPDWQVFFAEHGFALRDMRYLADQGVQSGRAPPLPLQADDSPQWQGFRRSIGYALLERKSAA